MVLTKCCLTLYRRSSYFFLDSRGACWNKQPSKTHHSNSQTLAQGLDTWFVRTEEYLSKKHDMHFAQIAQRKRDMGLILHMFFRSALKSAFLTVSPSRELFGYRMRALHLPYITTSLRKTERKMYSKWNWILKQPVCGRRKRSSCHQLSRHIEFTANPPQVMLILKHVDFFFLADAQDV